MANSLFLSVMSPSDTEGTISVRIYTRPTSYTVKPPTNSDAHSTINESDLVDFTVSVNVASAMNEVDLAESICQTLGSYLKTNNLSYSGWLSYPEETHPATFQVTRTDSFICIWSQGLFSIQVTTDCGALMDVASTPALITLAEMQEQAPVLIVNGSQLSDQAIINKVIKQAAFLTRGLRNNITLSTYAKEYAGNDTSAIDLKPGPVLDFDQPRIRRKDYNGIDYIMLENSKATFGLSSEGKKLRYRFDEIYIDTDSPFAKGNLVYISYIAGQNVVPEEIKTVVSDLVIYGLTGNPGIKSMKGGSGAFQLLTKAEQLKQIVLPAMMYKA